MWTEAIVGNVRNITNFFLLFVKKSNWKVSVCLTFLTLLVTFVAEVDSDMYWFYISQKCSQILGTLTKLDYFQTRNIIYRNSKKS
jgi:hypothetical protein